MRSARFRIIFTFAATALALAGCDNPRQNAAPAEVGATPARPGSGPVSTQTVRALPEPVVPKGAQIPSPAPGQANDHSSPAFKGGGKPDPNP